MLHSQSANHYNRLIYNASYFYLNLILISISTVVLISYMVGLILQSHVMDVLILLNLTCIQVLTFKLLQEG